MIKHMDHATRRPAVVIGLLVAGSFVSATAQTTSFVARHDYAIGAAGSGPRHVALADFDLDGKLDVAVTAQVANGVFIWMGRGDGLFGRQRVAPVPNGPVSIAAGDVNGDGLPDLAVGTAGDAAVRILIGNGDGSFRAPRLVVTRGAVEGLALDDLDGDGRPDLVTADFFPDGTVSVFRGIGDGSFGPRQSYPSGHYPMSVAVGDFDRDGRTDIAAANQTSWTLTLFLGRGDGTFQPAIPYPAGADTMSVAMADVDGDGAPDLVSANYGAADVSVNRGGGAGGGIVSHEDFEVGRKPWEVVAADLDGDGHLDLVTTDLAPSSAKAVSLIAGNGDGTFQPPRSIVIGPLSGGYGPNGIAAGDLNFDGLPDLVATNNETGTIAVLINSTRGAVIGEHVLWAGAVNATAAGGSLRKSGGCDGCYDAGAISSQAIAPGPGYVEAEFIAGDPATLRTVGLTHAFAAPTPEAIDFGIRLQAGAAEVRENGLYIASTLFVAGDSFRIALEAGRLTYLKNGVPFYNRAAAPTVPLYLAVALAEAGASIDNASITGRVPGSMGGGGGAGGIVRRSLAPSGPTP